MVTNDHKLGGLNQCKLLSHGSSRKWVSWSPSQGVSQQGRVTSGGSRRGALPFPAFRGCLHFWAPGAFLRLQCSASVEHLEICDSGPLVSSFSCKDPVIPSPPTRQSRLIHLKILSLITPAKSLCRVTAHSQVPGIRMSASLGDHCLSTAGSPMFRRRRLCPSVCVNFSRGEGNMSCL